MPCSRLHERPRRHGQQFIRAVADDDILRAAPVKLCQLFTQRLRRRIGIKPQSSIHRGLDRLQHLGGGRVRVLVRVKLDEAFDPRLLARDIGVKPADEGTDE